MKLLLFDVDGTLVDSGSDIDFHMIDILNKLISNGYHIGVVGGGKHEKVMKQMKNQIFFHHYFTECGCVYYKGNEYIYSKDIRQHKLYPYINILIKKSLEFLSQVDYTLTGHFIDLRTGIIYISLIGLSANEEERTYFKNYDNAHNIRSNLIEILINLSKKLNIENEIKIVEGGSVGIAIYPTEWDKIQVIPYLSEYDEIHYFGDKYEKGGNDYNLIHHNLVIGHKVNNKHDTYSILKTLQ